MATENDATLFGAAPGPVSFVTSSVPEVHGFKLLPVTQIAGFKLKALKTEADYHALLIGETEGGSGWEKEENKLTCYKCMAFLTHFSS